MYSIKPLEDLIIAVLLSESKIVQTKNGKELSFQLDNRKVNIFNNYISRNNLYSHISLDVETGDAHIKQSVILERIIREWTLNGIVELLDPRKIRTSMFLLWISLFARKTDDCVIINTYLSERVLKSLSYFFHENFLVRLSCKGNTAYIKHFHKIVLVSIQAKIPAVETAELNYLLSLKENQVFKKKIAEAEED